MKEFTSSTDLRDAHGSCNPAASQSVAFTRLALGGQRSSSDFTVAKVEIPTQTGFAGGAVSFISR